MERIGIIGGSGLYRLDGFKEKKKLTLAGPFGSPSARLVLTEIENREVVFLPRHGEFHQFSPSSINYRANIYAMKKLGVGWIISVTACGSLKKQIKPLDFVIPDQFIDRTNQAREQTFFDKDVVVHIGFSHPLCKGLAQILYQAAKKSKACVHRRGTYLNMEGPQFSTFAESNLYRKWGLDIIGMTNMTEARLAREAEICYATLAAVTDYDCWYETKTAVSVEVILNNLRQNTAKAKEILKEAIRLIPEKRLCTCKEALRYAIVTDLKHLPFEAKRRLGIFLKKYLRK